MNTDLTSKPNLNDPWDYAVCCIEMAMQMSLYSSPLRGACSSDNKAYLSEHKVGQIRNDLIGGNESGASYAAKIAQVDDLYKSFLRRTYTGGEETIDELDLTDDEYSITESVRGGIGFHNTRPGDIFEHDESEVETEDNDGDEDDESIIEDELDGFEAESDEDDEATNDPDEE